MNIKGNSASKKVSLFIFYRSSIAKFTRGLVSTCYKIIIFKIVNAVWFHVTEENDGQR